MPNYVRYEKILKKVKLFISKKSTNFILTIFHFLVKLTVFVLIVKNVIKNQKLNFPVKLCDIRKNVNKQNSWSQKDPPILYWTFFDIG